MFELVLSSKSALGSKTLSWKVKLFDFFYNGMVSNYVRSGECLNYKFITLKFSILFSAIVSNLNQRLFETLK